MTETAEGRPESEELETIVVVLPNGHRIARVTDRSGNLVYRGPERRSGEDRRAAPEPPAETDEDRRVTGERRRPQRQIPVDGLPDAALPFVEMMP
jgi:hypothetical protein